MKRTLCAIAVYTLLAMVVFGKLPQTFFQQDEWAIFGNMMYADKAGISLFDRLFIYEQYTHLIPLSNAATLFAYRFFGVSFAPWAIMSVIVHIINAYLVFVLTKRLLKQYWVALLAGGIFLINSISHQAVTWIATTIGTVGSTLFFLLSLLIFLNYLEHKKRKVWLLALSFLAFLCSLGLKETSIFAFLFFPIVWFFFTPKRSRKETFTFLISLTVLAIIYVLIRFFVVSISPKSPTSAQLSQPQVGSYVFRSVALPIRVLTQSIVPQKFMLTAARTVVRLGYPQFMDGGTPDPYVVESVGADIVSFLISMVYVMVAFAVGVVFKERNKPQSVRVVLLSFFFVALSALPFVVIPGRAGYNALLDGRHLYLTGIFSSIVVATVVWSIFLWARKRKFVVVGVFGFFLLAMSYNVAKIRRDIDYQVAIGSIRQSILKKIITSYPTLPQKVIFYIQSDSPYYGLSLEEPIVPFQSGFGQTLLVWYNAYDRDLPACLFERQYLYVLTAEDYKECQGRGFGYFRKTTSLNNAFMKYNFDPSDIISFRFTASTNTLEDVTKETRQTLQRLGKL